MKPFPVGGAIFDLDGVLVDTGCDHFEAWQQMARSLGFEQSPAQTRIDSCFDAIVDGNAITRTKLTRRYSSGLPPGSGCPPVPASSSRTRRRA